MQVVGFSETWVTPLLRRWWAVVAVGVAIAAVGVVLLFNPFAAVGTLVVLVAIGLTFAAVDELMQAERHEVRWPSYVLAAIWMVTAIAALLWPDVTLWALAVVVGVGLIVGGISEVMFAFRYRRELPRWGLWWLDGLLEHRRRSARPGVAGGDGGRAGHPPRNPIVPAGLRHGRLRPRSPRPQPDDRAEGSDVVRPSEVSRQL